MAALSYTGIALSFEHACAGRMAVNDGGSSNIIPLDTEGPLLRHTIWQMR